MLDDAVKRLETKIAFPEPFVPVLVRGNRIFAVVEMQRAEISERFPMGVGTR